MNNIYYSYCYDLKKIFNFSCDQEIISKKLIDIIKKTNLHKWQINITSIALAILLSFYNTAALEACYTAADISDAQANVDDDTALLQSLQGAYDKAKTNSAAAIAAVTAAARTTASVAAQLATAIANANSAKTALQSAEAEGAGTAMINALAAIVAEASEAEILAQGLVATAAIAAAAADSAVQIAAVALTVAAVALAAILSKQAIDKGVLAYRKANACCH